jgi:hypothetical protein
MTAWHEHDGGMYPVPCMALAGARTHGQACSPVRAHTTPPSGPVRGPPPAPDNAKTAVPWIYIYQAAQPMDNPAKREFVAQL